MTVAFRALAKLCHKLFLSDQHKLAFDENYQPVGSRQFVLRNQIIMVAYSTTSERRIGGPAQTID